MKVATHVLLFGQDKWIMRNIVNAYPHVDRIYVAYSAKPWVYNPDARTLYKKEFDLDIIRKSEFADKVTIIEGEWEKEEHQRNACVDQAVKDGMDYLIIHDADEFYFHNDFSKLVAELKKFPEVDYFKVPWYCFWKSFEYVVVRPDGSPIVGYPEFAINLKKGIRFEAKRRPTSRSFLTLPYLCYHGSYVLTDVEVRDKLQTWGHTNDFNTYQWYTNVWKEWTEDMTDLHMVTPPDWKKAVKTDMPLPEVIADMR
jgi:hypothetical protein